MPDRKLLGVSKITDGWKIQFPADVRQYLDERDGEEFQVGDRVAFYRDKAGQIVIERA